MKDDKTKKKFPIETIDHYIELLNCIRRQNIEVDSDIDEYSIDIATTAPKQENDKNVHSIVVNRVRLDFVNNRIYFGKK